MWASNRHQLRQEHAVKMEPGMYQVKPGCGANNRTGGQVHGQVCAMQTETATRRRQRLRASRTRALEMMRQRAGCAHHELNKSSRKSKNDISKSKGAVCTTK